MMRLGDVATYINGFAFKPDDWSEEGLPIIRIQDLTGNSYQMNRYAGEYNPKYEVNRGDVLRQSRTKKEQPKGRERGIIKR